MQSFGVRMENASCTWSRNVSNAFPDLRLEVLSCFPLSDGVMTETLEITGAEWRDAVTVIRDTSNTRDVEVLFESESSGVIRLTTTGCPLPRAVQSSGVTPVFPFRVANGWDNLVLAGNRERTSRFLEALRDESVRAEVVQAGTFAPERALTARQREILEEAVARGYYGFPRRITLTELAETVGVAKSTLSETLMIVEHKLLGNGHRERVLRGLTSTVHDDDREPMDAP
jgi:predicted DNA binding protein